MAKSKNKQLEEKSMIHYMPVVVSMAILILMPVAMGISCIGIFYPEMAASMNCNVSDISLMNSLGGISAFLISPFMGKWLEKYDARIVLSLCLVEVCACYVFIGLSTEPWQLWILGFMQSFGATGLLGLGAPILFNRWFKVKVGLLVGICMAMTGVGGVIFIQVDSAIMAAYSWQVAMFANAVSSLIVCLPLTIFGIHSHPEEVGLIPYGTAETLAKQEAEGLDANKVIETSVPVSFAMKTLVFWMLALFCFLCNFNVKIAFFFPTYVNSLADIGIQTVVTGAMLSTLAMAGQAIGKMLLGFTSDFSVKKAVVASVGVGIVGVLCCWLGAQTVVLPIGGFIFGFFYASCMVLCPMVIRDVLGSGKNYGIFWGRLQAIATLGSALGTYIWPKIAENAGGFETVFCISVFTIALVLVCALWAMSQKSKLPHLTDEELDEKGNALPTATAETQAG